MELIISDKILEKLRVKHGLTNPRRELLECFASLELSGGKFLEDQREDHRTDPPTLWFIGHTNAQTMLKVAFVPRSDGIYIKTAYPPNSEEISIYMAKGM